MREADLMAERTMLFTGGNGFLGKRIIANFLEKNMHIVLLTQEKFVQETETLIADFQSIPDCKAQLSYAVGDITQPNVGLIAEDIEALKLNCTDAFHLAAAYNLALDKSIGERINVQGTRNTMELLAALPNLRRLGYMSTTSISGVHKGLFSEEDFNIGQKFKNYYESSKFEAESIVREYRDRIPTIIFRPTIVVGDSVSGEIEKIDGPYYGFVMISRNLHIAIQKSGNTKCHIAPVDFLTDAIAAIYENANASGKVFHVGDPNALLYDDFFDLACERWGKFKPVLKLPPGLMGKLLDIPFIEKSFGVLKESFPYTHLPVEYDFNNTLAALNGTGLECPAVPEYLDVMIDYFKNHLNKKKLKKHRW